MPCVVAALVVVNPSDAVQLLSAASDDCLRIYLLQLTQCIKFEPYHDSPLVRMLMKRALASPYVVGHALFWYVAATSNALTAYADPLSCIVVCPRVGAHAGT